MSGRTILSRPRTRVYDANYNIGESYYRPALDRLNRKYSGRPLSPPRQFSVPKDVLDRHERAFMDEDLSTARRRAERHITEQNPLDYISKRAIERFDEDFENEDAARQRRLKARQEAAMLNDLEMKEMEGSSIGRKIKERSEKLFESVSNDFGSRRRVENDFSSVGGSRRSLRVSHDEDDVVDSKNLVRWTALSDDKSDNSAASLRAKQSQARLYEIEEEMNDLAERQAARERRSARLREILAECNGDDGAAADVGQSVRLSARREMRSVEY